jgi:Skp family chaperone for outer membrane proteins
MARAGVRVGFQDRIRRPAESLEQVKHRQKAKAEFKTKVDGLEKQLKEKKDEVERLEEPAREASVVGDVERRKLEGEFQHKQLDLKRRFEDRRWSCRRRRRADRHILKGLQKIVKDIGDQRGYDLVLERARARCSYKKGDDLTEEVPKYNGRRR